MILATGTLFDEYPRPWSDGRPTASGLSTEQKADLVRAAAGELVFVRDSTGLNTLADLGIAGMNPSRFDWHAAPRRIEVAPELAERLLLD